MLQPLYGGALARPFTTHHNALDRELYLRIATELYLKRLIVGGLEKVYEIGKDFRNEGISHKHNPEFTMLETYEAYADYTDVAAMTEELVATCRARDARHAPTIEREGETIDLTPPWRRVTLRDAILDETGIDIDAAHRPRKPCSPRCGKQASMSKPEPGTGWGKLVDELLSKRVEPKLIQPTFVLDYPIELSPFAQAAPLGAGAGRALRGIHRRSRGRERVQRAERPRRAARALRAAAAACRRPATRRRSPSTRTTCSRWSRACRPRAASGMGIDRLLMMLAGRHSIREVVLFPALRDR